MRWLLACFLLLPVSIVSADTPLYGEVHLGAAGVRHSDLDFYPALGSITAGWYVRPDIGVELFADAGFSDGEDSDIELGVEDAVGIALRLQSPAEKGLHGYVVLGYVDFSLAQSSTLRVDLGGVEIRETNLDERFTGSRLSIGMMQRLQRYPSLLVSAEYRNYYSASSIKVDGFLLGLRVNLP